MIYLCTKHTSLLSSIRCMKFQKKVFIVKEKMIFILYTNPYMVY